MFCTVTKRHLVCHTALGLELRDHLCMRCMSFRTYDSDERRKVSGIQNKNMNSQKMLLVW